MTHAERARQWLVTNLGMARDEWIASLAKEFEAVAGCDHVWDGPGVESADGLTDSATCSKCGIDALSVTLLKGG
jgi:hypothetical protein